MSGVRGRFGRLSLVVAVVVASLSWTPSVSAETVDGQFDGIGRLPADTVVDLQVLGRGGVPASGVDSVALNVTVTNPFFDGYLTVWPTGQTRPTASNLNFVRAQTVPNMVIVPVGTGGKVSLYLYGGSSDVVVDVLGWFPTGGGFTGLTPARLLDTRLDGETIDGASKGGGVLFGGSTIDLPVRDRGGVPSTGAGSVVLNVTLVNPTDATYLTVWPSGVARPTASNLNVAAGETRPNLVIVPLGSGGDVSLYLYSGAAHVLVDVLGWFPAGGAFTGLTPARLIDTRADGVTADGAMRATGALVGGSTVDLLVAGRGGVPSGQPLSVALNVTVTNPTAAAFLTVWPSGVARPTASNLNVVAGQTAPNMVLVPLGADGRVSIFLNRGSADVVVDVLGYVAGSSTFVGVTPARLQETRGDFVHVPLPVGIRPSSLVFDGTSIWMAGVFDGFYRLDPASGQSEIIPLPGENWIPGQMTLDGAHLWFSGLDGIYRFDTRTRELRLYPVAGEPGTTLLVAVDATNVWALSDGTQFVRINRATGATRVFKTPSYLGGPWVFDGRSIWWPNMFGTELGRFDTRTGQSSQVPLPPGHQMSFPAIAFGNGRVWVHTHTGDSPFKPPTALTWIEPATGNTGDIPLPDELWDSRELFFDGTSIWMASGLVKPLARIDVSSGVTLLDVPVVADPPIIPWDRVPRWLSMTSDGTNVWRINDSYSLVYFRRDL